MAQGWVEAKVGFGRGGGSVGGREVQEHTELTQQAWHALCEFGLAVVENARRKLEGLLKRIPSGKYQVALTKDQLYEMSRTIEDLDTRIIRSIDEQQREFRAYESGQRREISSLNNPHLAKLYEADLKERRAGFDAHVRALKTRVGQIRDYQSKLRLSNCQPREA